MVTPSHVTRAFTVLGLALVAWGFFFAVSRSSALDAANRTIAAQKEENAAKVEAVYRLSRELVKSESLKAVRMERELALERQKSSRLLDSANMATLTNMAVLQDSAATVPQLRTALSSQIATTDALAQQFREYLQSDSSAHALIEAERASVYNLLTLADSTIVAKNEALQALRKVGECRIVFGIKCPTRTSTFVLGALVTGAVVIALR